MSVIRHRAPGQRRAPRTVDELRRALHTHGPTYIAILHTGALAGVLPQLDEAGNPVMVRTLHVNPETGAEVWEHTYVNGTMLDSSDRLRLLQYLVDKILPGVKTEGAADTVPGQLLEAAAEDPSSLAHLSEAQLVEMVQEGSVYLRAPDAP